MADTVARQASGCTAQKAPINAVAEQPTPVILVIQGWPLLSNAQRVASTMWSVWPLTQTTPPVRPTSARAEPNASLAAAPLSTPRVCTLAPATLMISEPLPRITVGEAVFSSSSMLALRYAVAPAPTGSSTVGMPRCAAVSRARRMLSIQAGSSVPMLSTSDCAMPAMACTSSCACAITGEAPAASNTLAFRFITTKLVMLCTRGPRSRTALMSAQMSEEER